MQLRHTLGIARAKGEISMYVQMPFNLYCSFNSNTTYMGSHVSLPVCDLLTQCENSKASNDMLHDIYICVYIYTYIQYIL